MISYCLVCFRPRYSRLLIEELLRKTSVPFEVLVWLNVADQEFEQFLSQTQAAGHPLRIVGQTPENIGMAAFPKLFASSRCEMVAQMDDDVVCISPRIAETAAQIFRRFPNVGMVVADVWQDKYTNGARPPMSSYRIVNQEFGLYEGPIDGWFAVYRKSAVERCLAIPPARYMPLGAQIRRALERARMKGLLCTRIKVFHVMGPEYVSYFDMLDFEINKYASLGRSDMVQWYSNARNKLPPRAELERRVMEIRASLRNSATAAFSPVVPAAPGSISSMGRQAMQDPAKVYEAHVMNPACDMSAHLPLLRYLARGEVLEIGVRQGVSTAALLLGVQENGGHVYSIDVDPECARVFEGHPGWTFIAGHSRNDADRIACQVPRPNLLFIDGDHCYDMVLNDLERYGTMVQPGGTIL